MSDHHLEELRRVNSELENAKRELEKLNHFKSHLLSLASHQARSSLAIIKGYTQMLREGFHGPLSEDVAKIVSKIEFAAEDMINMVSNIIDLRKIDEGKIVYEFKRTDIVALARHTVEYFSPLARSRGLNLTVTWPDEGIFVSADEQHLKHVIQNLLDNAIKYTEKGFVKVGIVLDGKDVRFFIQDSGIGIKPGTSQLLFEEFVRDERVDDVIKGSGLGLHIAKSVIEAHGGKIWAESEGEGRGSTFRFSLPIVNKQ